MKFHEIYEDVFGNRTKIKILRIMLEYPDKTFSEHELARFTHVPQPTIHRNMGDLVNSNLILFSRMGKMNLFSLNRESMLYNTIQQLFRVEKHAIVELERMITKVFENEDDIISVNLYGSVLKRLERADSDIDIFVVVADNADMERIDEVLEELGSKIRSKFGNHLSCIVKKRRELREIRHKQIYEQVKKGKSLIGRKVLQ
jgi:predicted nucleotidyltransferase